MLGIGIVDAYLRVGIAGEAAEGGIYGTFTEGIVGKVIRRAEGLHKGFTDMGIEIGALSKNHALGPCWAMTSSIYRRHNPGLHPRRPYAIALPPGHRYGSSDIGDVPCR